DQHAVGIGQRATGQAGAAASRNERHLRRMAQPHNRLYLEGSRWKHNGARDRAQMNERVRLVRQEIRRLAQESSSADSARQLAEEGGVDHGMILSPVGVGGAAPTSRRTRPAE